MKTVLIAGCSSGDGLETARHVHAQGWRVVATMRTPRHDLLPTDGRIIVRPLDVTQPDSIAAASEARGPLDALVNNAGIGLLCGVRAAHLCRVDGAVGFHAGKPMSPRRCGGP